MKKIFIAGLCMFFLFLGCQEDELMYYDGPEVIMFSNLHEGTGLTMEVLTYSFGLTNLYEKDYDIRVATTGRLKSYPRKFVATIVEATDAVEGKHYVLGDTLEIPANSKYGYIPVRLFRGGTEDDTLRSLTFRLESNEHFDAEVMPLWFENRDRDTVNVRELTLNFTSAMNKPDAWMESWFGEFTLDKFITFNMIANLTPQEWIDMGAFPSDISLALAWAATVENYILMMMQDSAPGANDGWKTALKDNSAYARENSKGYMTMQPANNNIVIPEDWPTWPDDFN